MMDDYPEYDEQAEWEYEDEWYDDDPDDVCPYCGGTGLEDDISPCPHCDGEGYQWWL